MEENANTQQPLLENASMLLKEPKTPTQKVIRKTFKGTVNLSNLLPTGSVLAFQILSPIVTHQGQCKAHTSGTMTTCLLAICSISCFFLSFTDSFRDERGKVRYAVASFNGLRVIDYGSLKLSAEEAAKFRLKFIDFFHACASFLMFFAVAMLGKNVVMCFEPNPSDEERDLVALPLVIGLVCSFLLIVFPSKRHGIGLHLS